MSQSQIDKIISKYDKKGYLPRRDLLYTQRKKQLKQPHMVTFMDNNYTPTKQLKQIKIASSAITEAYGSGTEQLLRQLDDTQKKFVISQRNYAQICRKYDKLKQLYDQQQIQLQKQRKLRLQQLIDVQNKLHLLQTDNDKNLTKLQSKDHTIAILKQKLCQKQEQVVIFQQQLQQISHRLCQTMQLRQKQSVKIINKEISINNQQASRSLQLIKQKYQKHINILNTEINKFNIDLLSKQKQKKELLNQMQEQSRKQMLQIRQIKDALLKNQQQYKNWLDQAKRQKLDIIDKYEQQLRQLRKDQYTIKINKSDSALEDTKRGKMMIKELENKNIQLQNQIKNCKSEIQTLTRADRQSQIKFFNTQEELKHLKTQYLHQISENKKLLSSLKTQQEKYQNMRVKNNRNQIQMESIKRKSEQILAENSRLQKQVEILRADMGKQLKSLINVKKELNEATDNQMNMNSILTQTVMKLKAKIQLLQEQLQTTTTQLYAQRLQKAKILEQLQETKIQMKRQYELSIQNTRKELEEQIKQNLQGKTQEDFEKQKMYLQMFKLQRKYELLKSEVITSDQMLKMGSKMSKYYQRKVK